MIKTKHLLMFTFLLAIKPIGALASTVFESKSEFAQVAGSELKIEDWSSYQPETLLDGQTIRGVKYNSTSTEQLVVGSRHGAGWLIGYSRAGGRYASFSSETITFSFSQPVVAFGVSLSQGNSSGLNSYEGSSEWRISVDSGSFDYTSVANYSKSDFTGESYLGLLDLPPSSSFAITRLRSDANIVWDIRDISWKSVSAVPLPSSSLISITGTAFIWLVGWSS